MPDPAPEPDFREPSSPSTTLAGFAEEQFVSLTTFRRSGAPVSVPVWVALSPDGDGALVVSTADGSGKVKRIDHDPRVVLRPCSRRGQVAAGAPRLNASATVLRDPEEAARLYAPIAKKYGLQATLIMGVEKLLRRRGASRVILRITDAPAPSAPA